MKSLSSLLPAFTALILSCNPTHKNPSTPQPGNEPRFAQPRHVEMNPTLTPATPEQSLQSFRLPEGYSLELVAAEPMISEPAAVTWDGNGRMYVAQLETYMQTIDAKDQDKPISRLMLLEDTDNDGRMDKSSVFIDSLLSPRMLLCVGKELLVNETNTYDIHAYKDTDGDGRADQKRAVYTTPVNAYGNVEHQRTGLDWNIDNWIYVTTDPVRFRYENGMLKPDSLTYGSNGQWGLTHDNAGNIYFSKAASGTAATGYQVNPEYGQLDIIDPREDSLFRLVWPGVKTPDANARLRSDSTLISLTAVCGQSVFRGDRLPEHIQGDYFAAEPVGRIVRRAKFSANDGVISLRNVYENDEFITSSDMNFRPVNTFTGPDGCLYIVDMYRGIIQESTWVKPDMPIYKQIKSKNLDKNIRRGRIYRVRYKGIERGPMPRMLEEPAAALVKHLSHPNGWWRDNAQKEIIVRHDLSVAPSLHSLLNDARNSSLARLHALWTLEGLGEISKETLLACLDTPDAELTKAAIRISERYITNGDKQLLQKLVAMKNDKRTDVRAQLVLSLQFASPETARGILSAGSDSRLLSGIDAMLTRNEEIRKYGAKLSALDEHARQMVIKGAGIFRTLCISCHGPEGEGLPAEIAPPLIGKFKLIDQKEGVIKILLNGLKGPVDGKEYPDQMMAMGNNDDEWIASVLNYVRYDLSMKTFPNMPSDYLDWVIIRPEDVRKVRSENKGRNTPWTWQEIMADRKK